ncbi:MAG TPA: sugar phosphate nucleotidyltransferase [Polyangia bacterium]|nr:sugar phosphate nucleotidyltransferase [Polyangia bacterium]
MNARGRVDEWAIVLAAGEGQRLAGVTRALYGHDVPKQFAALDGDRTMLQQTMARAARVTSPERTVVVVAAGAQADLARAQLAESPRARLVEQPRNVGTLAGLLLPLAHVLHAAPRAPVVVYPADHHVRRLPPFIDAVRDALAAIERAPARAVLVGASADRPATDLGWILRGQALDADERARAVECFVEKPAPSSAAQLLACGALWNTLVIAMDGAAFWDAALSAHPALARPFERYRASVGTAREAEVRREVYAELPTLDLSRDFLAKRGGLAVVELADAGWSDCGTPERLFETLAHVGNLERLLGRLGAGGARPFALARGAD